MYGEKVYLRIKKSVRAKVDYYKYPTRQVATAEITKLGNQSPYFTITVDSYTHNHHMYAAGCQHDLVEKYWPKSLAPYVKWHLTHTEGPMYYIENGLFHLEDNNPDYFKSTVKWGTVEGDKDHEEHLNQVISMIKIAHDLESEKFKKWLAKDQANEMKPYLEERLPELMAHFREDMKTLFGQDIYELLEQEKNETTS